MRNKVGIILFLFPLFIFSQLKLTKKFRQLSFPEKKWFLAHPFCAVKVNKITKQTFVVLKVVQDKKLLDGFENGGKLDAFRHSYTMALLAQKITVRKLRKLGNAHEKGNYLQFKKEKNEDGEQPDSLSTVMDLLNNEIGFEIGTANKKINADSIKNLIILKINSGKNFYMKRNENGNYLTCNNKEIILQDWKGKWAIPKCLIKN
jgi:hypothetical protein